MIKTSSAFLLTEQRLQEKEKLLQELQGQYHDLGKRHKHTLHQAEAWPPFTVVNPPFLLLSLSVAEFPSPSGNAIDPEVRKSRAAVIASEPIPEVLEITRNQVKKTERLVIRAANEKLRLYVVKNSSVVTHISNIYTVFTTAASTQINMTSLIFRHQ